MSIVGWIATIGGAPVDITLFEVICNWLFRAKKTKMHPSQDLAYQTRIRWWERV